MVKKHSPMFTYFNFQTIILFRTMENYVNGRLVGVNFSFVLPFFGAEDSTKCFFALFLLPACI